ncbi:hypothetical protein OIU84_001347 [Salix udensis]|uniref:Uncharacterized protein n=1 Tax=Salix udensis TaxID=889485 RepID=A0AAD6K6X5_9ROSI|nr:hypothetical protein OIU84_001347 [Salix udensis]
MKWGGKERKEMKLEKPVGYVIMDFLDKLVEMMDKEFGSTAFWVKVGEIVAERAREEDGYGVVQTFLQKIS